jgi:two-component system nitrogen regulation sensor histidine kinase NtrY
MAAELSEPDAEAKRRAAKHRARRLSAWAAGVLAALGVVLAGFTAAVLDRASRGAASATEVRTVLLIDLIYIIALAALVIWTIGKAIAARRARSAGSKLHLRLSGIFTLVALAPTVLVAVFATLTVNFGMEAWFSNQVRSVVRNALETAEAYATEHRGNIVGDALAMANDINRAADVVSIDVGALGELVRQQAFLRELPEAYVLDGSGEILARGEFSYLFTLDLPSPQQFAAARAGEVVVIDDQEKNEMRALVHLTGLIDGYLYISRRVEGEILQLLDETRDTVALYERLERERDNVLFDFALLYLGFAVVVILAAVWLGLWFAGRLAKPIGRLAGAAELVGAGDFGARVKEPKGDDEIALLARVFNRMTAQVKQQRDALIEANRETERRRLLLQTVLSGVSAGVVGLDCDGRIDLVNDAALGMLGVARPEAEGRALSDVAPALTPLLLRAARSAGGMAQEQIRLRRGGTERELLWRITPKKGDPAAGAVVTIDDLTDLVQAQRMAAWGDVARRIAHEIKNPLTPIQLSADRLKRKFQKMPDEDREALSQYADVISRQAGDIRRMVDEFAKFARMPEPQTRPEDLGALLRSALLLQREGANGVRWTLEAPEGAVMARCDRGLMNQALVNLMKTAAEAIEGRLAAAPDGPPGEVRVALRDGAEGPVIEIADNGAGLPEDRSRLMEPYVTTRARGTGLGLAIVRKIVEQHGGVLTLTDAPPFADGASPGALARLCLPASDAKAAPEPQLRAS